MIILAASIYYPSVHQAATQTDQATLKLQAANNAVNQAFIAVLDAEKAGANVNDLMSQLNYALDVLAVAENSYRAGDLNRAGIQAGSVVPIARKVASDAQSAKLTAIVNQQNGFYFSIAFAVLGSGIFILILFYVWVFFKRRYIKSLAELKPELVHE